MRLNYRMEREAEQAALTRQGCIDSSIVSRWADEVATLDKALRLARDKLVSPNTSSYITDEIDAALRGIPLSELRPPIERE